MLGLLVGMAELRDSLVAEYDDLADGFGAVSQSYTFNGVMNENSPAEQTAGSSYQDLVDIGPDVMTRGANGFAVDRSYGGDTLDIGTSIPPEVEGLFEQPDGDL